MNVKEVINKEGDSVIEAELTGDELKRFLGADYGSIYGKIKELINPKPQTGPNSTKLSSFFKRTIPSCMIVLASLPVSSCVELLIVPSLVTSENIEENCPSTA